MNFDILKKYIELCNLWNVKATWGGLNSFRKAFR